MARTASVSLARLSESAGPQPTRGRSTTGDVDDSDGVLREVLQQARALDGRGPAVIVLHGPPGIGKFTRADLAAHVLQEDEGAVVLELRPGRTPRGPANEYRELLRMLGARAVLPLETDADHLVEDYAKVTRNVRTVLLLDDVTDWSQVRPLLPAGPQGLVIATSLQPYDGQLGLEPEKVQQVHVKGPDASECAEIFAAAVGGARPLPEDLRIAEIVDVCERRPLAVKLAGALCAHHTGMSGGRFVAELRRRQSEQQKRWLRPSKQSYDLPMDTVLSWAYDDLLEPLQRDLLQHLALPETSTVNAYTAAALTDHGRAGTPRADTVRDTTRVLDELADLHFLERQHHQRFRIASAVRKFAAAQLSVSQKDYEDVECDEEAALRLLAAYRRLTLAAQSCLDGQAVSPLSPFSGPASARLWLEEERGAIMRSLQIAERIDPGITYDVVKTLCTFFVTTGDFGSLAMLADVVGREGQESEDPESPVLARILCVVGLAVGILARKDGQLRQSYLQLRDVREQYAAVGDLVAEAWATRHMGVTLHCMGDFALAMRHLRWAQELLEESIRRQERDPNSREAWVLHSLGALYTDVGAFEEAKDCLDQSIRLHEAHGNLRGGAWAKVVLAACLRERCEQEEQQQAQGALDRTREPRRLLDEAAWGFERTGDRSGLACVRLERGRIEMNRDPATARQMLHQALAALTAGSGGVEGEQACPDRRALAWTHFEYARSLRNPDEAEQRNAELAESEALFDTMGDRYGAACVAWERATSEAMPRKKRRARLQRVREAFRQLGNERKADMVRRTLGEEPDQNRNPDSVLQSHCTIQPVVVGSVPVVRAQPFKVRLEVQLDPDFAHLLESTRGEQGHELRLMTMAPCAEIEPFDQLLPPLRQGGLSGEVELTPRLSGRQEMRFTLLAESNGSVLQEIECEVEVKDA
ncbi:hypothetical protein GCM10022403_021140 [Streptomyces coacervatus]|uniref:Tetratricopeptide repeat protein n=1 Tax=Streptomyces coacervatus TaxID=647381 RepID=A0ABP7H620_9ACTN|nr:tetratricopeptide repeat protein [Streptomyces coacervatus]MDF2267583.1 hypothetical protein [Streptomyces coacervatus]